MTVKRFSKPLAKHQEVFPPTTPVIKQKGRQHNVFQQIEESLDTGQELGIVRMDAPAVGDDKTNLEPVKKLTNLHTPYPPAHASHGQ